MQKKKKMSRLKVQCYLYIRTKIKNAFIWNIMQQQNHAYSHTDIEVLFQNEKHVCPLSKAGGWYSILSVCLSACYTCLSDCVCVCICQVVFLCATGGCKSLEISQKCSEQLGFSVGGRHLLLSQNTLPYCNRPARHVLQQLAKNKMRHMHIPHV